MNTYTATAPMRPIVTFRRVAVVLTALVTALSIFWWVLSNPPDDGGQNCQSEQAQILRTPTSDMQLCVPDSTLPREYRVILPQQ